MKNMRSLVLLLLWFLADFRTGFAAGAPHVPGQLIVQFQPGKSPEDLNAQGHQLKPLKLLSAGMRIHLFETLPGTEQSVLLSLQKHPAVVAAQFNHYLSPRNTIPNDSLFDQQWGLQNTGQSGGKIGADIRATRAWDLYPGPVTALGDSPVIAIVDNTFDFFHPDLNFYANRSEIPGNGIDDDGNNYIDDYRGYDFFSDDADLYSTGSDANHSTHTSGIAAARFNNRIGIAGVCPGALILPVRYGITQESNVVAAYSYVWEMRKLYNATFGSRGAYVVACNSSFGIDNARADDVPIWCAMYDSMGTVGILSTGATANSNINVDDAGDIPSDCPSRYLLVCTNTSRMDLRNPGAAFGPNLVDLGAPGTSIFSTYPNAEYSALNGTSMATPHVTGSIALLYTTACNDFMQQYQARPDSLNLFIKNAILRGSDFNSDLYKRTSNGGRLNLYDAARLTQSWNCNQCPFEYEVQFPEIGCTGSLHTARIEWNIPPANSHQVFWNGIAGSDSILNLEPGLHQVEVRSGGCSYLRYFKIKASDSALISNLAVIQNTGQNPRLVITASAGNQELQFSLDGSNFQNSGIFEIPGWAQYTIRVRTELGCITTLSQFINHTADPESGNRLRFYPNPAKDHLYFIPEEGEAITHFNVFSIEGKLLLQQSGPRSVLNLDGLPSGCFFVEGKTNLNRYHFKLIKE